MRHVFFMLCLVLGLVRPAMADEPLRVAIDVPYPPFAFLDDKGELTGFDVDITKALCAEIKRTCVFVMMPFDEIFSAIADGKIDISVSGMGDTPERREFVDFTDRYFRSHSIFIEKPGAVSGITPADLKGKRVGAQGSSIQEAYLNDEYKDSIIVTRARYGEILDCLKTGEVDVVLVDGLPGYDYLKSPAGEGLETVGPPVNSGMLVGDSAIAVSKKLPNVRIALNEAIKTLRRNGEYGKINRKYFDFNVY